MPLTVLNVMARVVESWPSAMSEAGVAKRYDVCEDIRYQVLCAVFNPPNPTIARKMLGVLLPNRT